MATDCNTLFPFKFNLFLKRNEKPDKQTDTLTHILYKQKSKVFLKLNH